MMDRQHSLPDDRTSDCRSFGSNFHPSSQSRKISIGIMADSSLKTRARSVNEGVTAAPTAEDITSSKGNTFKDGLNRKGVTVPALGKQSEVSNQENSPWVSTRSLHQNVPSSAEANISKQALRPPAVSNMINGSNGIKEALAVPSVRYFENQVSTLQSGDGKQKKFCRRTNGKVQQIDGASVTAQEALVPEKEVIEEKAKKRENTGNETLRMKLWEILGTVSSPGKQPNSQAFETGTSNLKSGWKSDENVSPVVKPKQDSVAVGNESNSPNHTIRRPVTHSRTRRKSPSKVEPKKVKNTGSFTHKEKHLDNNIFSFEEGWSGRLSDPISGGSSMSKIKDDKIKISRIKPHKLSFCKHDNAHDIQQATDRSKTKSAAEKSLSPEGNTTGNRSLPMKNIELVYPNNENQGKDSHPSPVIEMKHQLEGATLLKKNILQREDSINPSLKKSVDPQDDHWSPTLKMNTSIDSSPVSPQKTNRGELDGHSPAHRVFDVERIRSFQSLLSSKTDYYEVKVQEKSPDDEEELEDSPVAKSVHIMKDSLTENRDSKSSSGTSDSESSENCSSIDGYKCLPSNRREPESLFPEVGKAEKPKFAFHHAKRHRDQDNVEVMFTPTPGALKETEERSILHGAPELAQENELASAVALFALALERVKSKMDSITSKKSAEILMCVAKEIHLQLQNAESQIQTDVGKLLSLGKTKRKRLETRLQEQQEQLKFIHERFLQEVNQHIQNCRSTLEGLEAHQMEFKGNVEKQKALHRKLLLQAEESIETQLSDAQRKITTVHKLARGKMVQLRYVISKFLKDDLLS